MNINRDGTPRGYSRIIARAVKSGNMSVLITLGGARIVITGSGAGLDVLAAKLTRRGNMVTRVSDSHGEHVYIDPESPVFFDASARSPRIGGSL